MAKMQKKKTTKVRGLKTRRPIKLARTGLDVQATNHVKQLADPCNGPLTHPVYDGFTRGNLVRLRGTFQVGTGVGETCGFFLWDPQGNFVYNNGSVNTSTTYIATAVRGPHDTYVSNNFDTYRVVSACITIMPNASEYNRQGLVYAGTINGGLVNEGATVSIGALSSLMPTVERAPNAGIEVVWLPSFGDAQFVPRNATAAPTAFAEGSSAVAFGFSGAVAATGYTVICTATYEFLQPSGSGVIQQPSVPSKNTINDVLREFWRRHGSTVKRVGIEALSMAVSALG